MPEERNDLAKWLEEELSKRGWSHRELGRRSGMSQTSVSGVIAGTRPVGADFCVKVAKPLHANPERILRMAGILPKLPGGDFSENISRLTEDAKQLTPGKLGVLMLFAEFLKTTQTSMEIIKELETLSSDELQALTRLAILHTSVKETPTGSSQDEAGQP
jgi:transcriptional regulator with XRE-family HTH domain